MPDESPVLTAATNSLDAAPRKTGPGPAPENSTMPGIWRRSSAMAHDGRAPVHGAVTQIGEMMDSVAPAMSLLIRVLLGGLLLAHGLVHLLFLAPDVPVFSLEHSRLVPTPIRTSVAYTLLVATIIAFAALALAVWGVPGLSAVWPVVAVGAAALSTMLLALYWNWQLAFGVLINVVVAAAAVARLNGLAFTST